MRLTALCICGTLLALSSLSWITAESDGVLLGDKGFGSCTVTLRPEGPCRQVQHESTCPYVFSLPPLTVHLPQQLRELEKIMEDLQKLKDSVDELREMCADCTVSQTESECGRQRESEHEKLNERKESHEDEKNWVNERLKENGFRQECGTGRINMEGDGDSKKGTTLEKKERNKWEAERESNGRVIKEKEKDEALEMDEKTQTEVTTGGGNEKKVEIVRENVADRNNGEKERGRKEDNAGGDIAKEYIEDKLENGKERNISTNVKNKGKTEESVHHVWQPEKKETETQTKASDGKKMSEDHDENTNQKQEQHREGRKKETEKRIKVKQNDKLKETESTGRTEKEKTIKEGAEDSETGTAIKTGDEKTESVQGGSDGESSSSKGTKRTDFAAISPTPHSTIITASRLDFNKATSSLPSPTVSSSISHLITDVGHEITTQSTGLGVAELPNPDAGPDTTTTMSTLSGQHITNRTAGFDSRLTPGGGLQGHISSTTTTTTTTAHQENVNAFLRSSDDSRWTAKKNISSNTKTGVKPPPGREPNEKHKPKFKPEADQTLKNPKTDSKPDQAPLPDKKPKRDQKQQPSHHKPTTDLSKPGKDSKRVQTSNPEQRTPPIILPIDKNLKNNPVPKHGQDHATHQNKLPIQKPKPHNKSVTFQRPTSHLGPQKVNTTRSDKYPLFDREHRFDEIPATNQTSKPERKHTLKTDKPDQKQNPDNQPKGEERTKPDQSFKVDQKPKPVREPEPKNSKTANFTPKPNEKEKSGENPSHESNSNQDSTAGQKTTPDQAKAPHNQKPKPSQNLPKRPKPGQVPKPNQKHTKPGTSSKPKPNEKTKTGHIPQINKNLKTPNPGQKPNLNHKSGPPGVPEAESNKTPKPRPPSSYGPPSRSTVMPGATPVQRPKPAVHPKQSPMTKTLFDPPHISWTFSDHIQSFQTNTPSASGPIKHTAEVTHSPRDTEFIPSIRKTVTPGPENSNSLENGASPHLHTLPEDSTMSPNSRIMSDLRPQTASAPPSIPMTTKPNKIIHRILPTVIPSNSPGSTKSNLILASDPSIQTKKHYNMEEMAPAFPTTHSSVSHTTSTLSPDYRSTTAATPGPELLAEASTPSARELRVKINQVPAFFNNSLNPNGRPPNRHPKEYPEEKQGDSRRDRTDSKLPTVKPPKATIPTRDCSDHLLRGETKSGVYLVAPDPRTRSFRVYCDMQRDGGGWTVLQRRQDGSVSFNRTWAEYQSGFGNLDGGEFWLGNSMIHQLTRDRDMTLRVELEDFDGVTEYAQYAQFRVASERQRYRLSVGGYSGTAGDALRFSKSYDHHNRAFTTPDRDHDRYPSGNCGAYYSSGWWFDACMAANLNGRYYMGRYKGVRDGIFWGTWHNITSEYYPTNERQSFKAVRMMIRPRGFAP